MELYPIMIHIEHKHAVVIGGGSVASRKAADLLKAGARVKIISPEVDETILALADTCPGNVAIVKRTYEKGDLSGASIAFTATDDNEVNRAVYQEAIENNIFINTVDVPELCSFYVPSWFKKGDLIVSVSTSGASPAMAGKIRRELEETVPDEIDAILCTLKKIRTILKEDNNYCTLGSPERGTILKYLVRCGSVDQCLDSEDDDLKRVIDEVCRELNLA